MLLDGILSTPNSCRALSRAGSSKISSNALGRYYPPTLRFIHLFDNASALKPLDGALGRRERNPQRLCGAPRRNSRFQPRK